MGPGAIPRLHVLLSAAELGDARALDAARAMLGVGPLGLHLRARLPARVLFERAVELSRAAGECGGWCIVNGRPDIALAASAQAVQLGRAALPADAVAKLRPDASPLRIGVSVHGPAEACEAARNGADYLVWGTACETPSHPGRPGAGPDGLRETLDALERQGSLLPVLAIGGIDRDRAPGLVFHGAAGVVVGRAVWSAGDPVAAAAELMGALESAVGSSKT